MNSYLNNYQMTISKVRRIRKKEPVDVRRLRTLKTAAKKANIIASEFIQELYDILVEEEKYVE